MVDMRYRVRFATQLAAMPIPGYHEPYRETATSVEGEIWLVGRIVPCFICGDPTEFRDLTDVSVPVCSDECQAQSLLWQGESNGPSEPPTLPVPTTLEQAPQDSPSTGVL